MTVQSYSDLEIFQLAMQAAVLIHQMSPTLPHYETHEVGSQVRRSAKSIPANIAEGFGRRYKNEYIRFLTYALASCDETRVHLDILRQTGNLAADEHASLSSFYDQLGRKVNRFLEQVIAQHVEPYRDDADTRLRDDGQLTISEPGSFKFPVSSFQLPASSFQFQVAERSLSWQNIPTFELRSKIASPS